jgi:hypothetical protein
MTEYRIYCVDENNHIVSRHECKLSDDLDALDKARELCGKFEVEIWAGARRVAQLSKDGAGSLRVDAEARS